MFFFFGGLSGYSGVEKGTVGLGSLRLGMVGFGKVMVGVGEDTVESGRV